MKVINVDLSPELRKIYYPESYLKNMYLPSTRGEFIMFLADDDYLEPTCLEMHIKEFERNKAQRINYHGWRVVYVGTNKPDDIIRATRIYGPTNNRKMRPGGRVDGGAVMFKKVLLKEVEFSPEMDT